MTLRETCKQAFAQAPAGFAWGADDSQAVSHLGAVLQLHADGATLSCTLPPGEPHTIKRNVNLLLLMLLAAGWPRGNAWLTARLRAATTAPPGRPLQHEMLMRGVRYRLLIDRIHNLVTLRVKDERPEAV